MVRVLMIVCVLCATGAVGLALWPDPWAKAEQKAVEDADRFAALIGSSDRIAWRLTEDLALRRIAIWDAQGALRYPPPEGVIPQVYEMPDEMTADLSARQAQVTTPHWEPFDRFGAQLLHCRARPAVCLIYDRASLEQELDLPDGALSLKPSLRDLAPWLAVVALVCAAVAFGLARRSRVVATGFRLVPERHTALRDSLEVSLSPRDLKLLVLLQARDGAVVTKDELYDAGWGREFMPNSRALDQHIVNLRRKLDPDKTRPVLIETVHGVGYRLLL